METQTADVNEASRTYFFKSGNTVTFEDIIAVELVTDDIHVIYLGDGTSVTVSGDFDAVQVEDRND